MKGSCNRKMWKVVPFLETLSFIYCSRLSSAWILTTASLKSPARSPAAQHALSSLLTHFLTHRSWLCVISLKHFPLKIICVDPWTLRMKRHSILFHNLSPRFSFQTSSSNWSTLIVSEVLIHPSVSQLIISL